MGLAGSEKETATEREFREADLDQSGAINYEEWKKMPANWGASERTLKRDFNELDVDHDGTIDAQEFQAFQGQLDERRPKPQRWSI